MIAQKIRFEKVATAVGSFWRARAPYAQLREHLRSFMQGPFFKTASLGGSAEGEFEQAFSSLAYAYLKDKAPRLLDFMIGFQLVDRNEDNTKAMGIFGFQVGDQWLYAPVFFLNGDLKGHELLYIKKQDSFVPMKENWVNYLMSRKPHVLGERSENDTYQMGGLMPDIYSLTASPTVGMGKRGADLHIDGWARPALPLIGALLTKSAKGLYGMAKPGTKLAFDQVVANPFQAALAEVAPQFDLNAVLPRSFGLLKQAFDVAQRYPAIKRGFDRFYGKDCFSRWAAQLHASQLQNTTQLVHPVEKRAADQRVKYANDLSLLPQPEHPRHPLADGTLQIFTLEHGTLKIAADIKVDEDVPITENKPELDDDERAKLLRDGVLIKDKRDPHGDKASIAYNTQVEQKLTNPHETGLYQVLEKPGDFTRMLVVSNPMSVEGQQDFCTLVRIGDSDSKAWLNACRGNLWADKVELREDFDKWFKGLGSKDSLSKGGVYLAINEAGDATVPFEIRETYGDGAYKADFKSRVDYNYGRPDGLPKTERTNVPWDNYVSPWGAKLLVEGEDKKGTKLRAIQGEVRIPGNYKFLKLKDPPKPKKEDKNETGLIACGPMCDSESGSEVKPIQPGKLEDVQLLFMTKTSALKLFGDHNEVTIRTDWAGDQRFPCRDAMVSLVRDHGLTEKAARDMVGLAAAKGAVNFRIHYGIGFGDRQDLVKRAYAPNMSMLDGGPSAPSPMPPEYGVEMFGNRNAVRSQYPDEMHQMVPELDSTLQDQRHRNMWQNYTFEDFQQSKNQAQQAAQEGQKEIFDTSMISGMLKSVRQDSLVDRYLGDLVKALDKLGRILFMFYWHQEEFEDRYGKHDLPELEDSLRNAFETLGDVTLFLKEKTIEPSFGELGDPSVEEAARG